MSGIINKHQLNMKDKVGISRGKCTIPACECTEYLKPEDSTGLRCDYCDHAPTKHAKTVTSKLGACTKCRDCLSYESEDDPPYPTSFPVCEYCDCPARYHEDANRCNDIQAFNIHCVNLNILLL